MRKNRVRLTESQLHRVIKESVRRVLRESDYEDYLNSDRRKRHLQYNYNHPYDTVKDEKDYIDFSLPSNKPDYYDFTHSDNDSRWVRPHELIQGSDEYWEGVNEPKKTKKDVSFERALSSADKRPLHRKGSLNRELGESKLHNVIKESVRRVLREYYSSSHYFGVVFEVDGEELETKEFKNLRDACLWCKEQVEGEDAPYYGYAAEVFYMNEDGEQEETGYYYGNM